MNKGLFITGTDTEVGKTLITSCLIKQLVQQGQKVAGMKPIASGCEHTDQGYRNDDALKLIEQSNLDLSYDLINSYSFQPPVSPHFAAEEAGVVISLDHIIDNYEVLREEADWTLIEGVGGWEVPLGDQLRVSDLAKALSLPVVLVVGLKLGCINHALLTAKAIKNSGLSIIACVGTQVDRDYCFRIETIKTLEKELDMPVQEVPWVDNAHADLLSEYLTTTIQQIHENI